MLLFHNVFLFRLSIAKNFLRWVLFCVNQHTTSCSESTEVILQGWNHVDYNRIQWISLSCAHRGKHSSCILYWFPIHLVCEASYIKKKGLKICLVTLGKCHIIITYIYRVWEQHKWYKTHLFNDKLYFYIYTVLK